MNDASAPLHLHGCILRPSIRPDCEVLAPKLRRADVRELDLAGHGTPIEALTAGFENSKKCISIMPEDGDVELMLGVAWTRTPRVGLVWMLSSNWILKVSRPFLRYCPIVVAWMLEDHDLILNDVHDENITSLRWMQWLGFEQIGHTPDFGKGAPFSEMALFNGADARAMYLKRQWPSTPLCGRLKDLDL